MSKIGRLRKKVKGFGLKLKGNETETDLELMLEAYEEELEEENKKVGGKTSKEKLSREEEEDDDGDGGEEEEKPKKGGKEVKSPKAFAKKEKTVRIFLKSIADRFKGTKVNFKGDGSGQVRLGKDDVIDVFNMSKEKDGIYGDLLVTLPMAKIKKYGFKKEESGYGAMLDQKIPSKPTFKMIKAIGLCISDIKKS